MECPLTVHNQLFPENPVVLILVLMECPLTERQVGRHSWQFVLILVLMECPLTGRHSWQFQLVRVLILVLMECPLTNFKMRAILEAHRLNPCSNGMPSDVSNYTLTTLQMLS